MTSASNRHHFSGVMWNQSGTHLCHAGSLSGHGDRCDSYQPPVSHTCFCQVAKDRVCHNLLLSEDLGTKKAQQATALFRREANSYWEYMMNMVSIQARSRILEPPSTFYVGLSHHVAALSDPWDLVGSLMNPNLNACRQLENNGKHASSFHDMSLYHISLSVVALVCITAGTRLFMAHYMAL